MSLPPPDQERQWLLQAQRERDPQAFARLVARHQGRVRAVLRQLTHGHTALADELAQETFLQAWRALPNFRHDAQWSTCLYRIAYREFLQHRRQQFVGGSVAYSDEWDSTATEPTTEPDHEMRLDLTRALAQLHPQETASIVLCYHAGLSHTQAAEVLGLPLGTLKSHLMRGRAKLQVLLAAWSPVEAARPQRSPT